MVRVCPPCQNGADDAVGCTDGAKKGHCGEAAARTGTTTADWGTAHAWHEVIWVLTVPIWTGLVGAGEGTRKIGRNVPAMLHARLNVLRMQCAICGVHAPCNVRHAVCIIGLKPGANFERRGAPNARRWHAMRIPTTSGPVPGLQPSGKGRLLMASYGRVAGPLLRNVAPGKP